MREEEKNQSSQGVKKLLKKRWAYPAIYIASAALILTGVLWFQNSSTNEQLIQKSLITKMPVMFQGMASMNLLLK